MAAENSFIDLTADDDCEERKTPSDTGRIYRLRQGPLFASEIDSFLDFIGESFSIFELYDADYFNKHWKKLRQRSFKKKFTFFRVTTGGHHLLVVADNKAKEYKIQNSLAFYGNTKAAIICDLLRDEFGYNCATARSRDRRSHHQQNGTDCGAFVILNVLRTVGGQIEEFEFRKMDVAQTRAMLLKYKACF